MSGTPQPPGDEGLWGSLRRLGRTLLGVIQTRLEILSTEIAEERFHLARTLLVVLGALFCLQAGVMLAVLFIVLVVSPDHRLATIGISALVLLLGALGSGWWLLSWLKKRPPMFAATIAELRKDRERLGGGT
jgi:uncharacterized membrane protein YqjE